MDKQDTKAVYDEIAPHFSQTRAHPWPEVTAFLDGVDGAVGVDIGCGNGRHLAVLADRVGQAIGIDVSPALLAIARERLARRPSLLVGDATALPIATNSVAVGLYIATVHHLPTRQLRRRSFDELARVLAPDGTALVSAWSTAHDRFDRTDSFETTLDWTLPSGETVSRFYHITTPDAFRAELADSALTVTEMEVSSGNCYARVTPSP